MFACLFGSSPKLAELASQFSPLVEMVSEDTVAFSIAGLGRMIGSPSQIAAAISRAGQAMGLEANLAIAANASAAILAARRLPGVTVISAGQEARVLEHIPIEALAAEPETIETLQRWGIATCGDLAALPEEGVIERLGQSGQRLRRLALGQGTHLLDIAPPEREYTARHTFDDPVELLEPLLFVISAQLHDLMREMRHEGKAVRRINVTLELGGGGEFVTEIDLPFPMGDPKALLKQAQLSLEARPPHAASVGVRLTLHPDSPRIVPGGLFMPAAPEPEKLQTLLARLHALVGAEHVGTPEILDTHRPDAYRLRDCLLETEEPGSATARPLRLALRYFRPPIPARVALHKSQPCKVSSARVSGEVVRAGGPWRTSGDWWADTAWSRDEWDVLLTDHAIYRIYVTNDNWFLDGSYD